MERNVVLDEIIPATYARAYEVKKGQVIRIYEVEDSQVSDLVFFNAHDYKEWFHVGQSWLMNVALGTGDAKNFKHFYSKPPRENIMLTVLEDTVNNHAGYSAGRCSQRMTELIGRSGQERFCQQNLEEALAPYGITGDQIGDCFNLFVNSDQGSFTNKMPTARKDDYIDLLAEMDILAGISACPAPTITNNFRAKPLGVKVFE